MELIFEYSSDLEAAGVESHLPIGRPRRRSAVCLYTFAFLMQLDAKCLRAE